MLREWLPFNPRLLAAALIILISLNIIFRGYFKGMGSYLKGLSFRPYALFLILIILIVAGTMFFDQAIYSWVQGAKEISLLKGMIKFGDLISSNVEFWVFLGMLNLFAMATRRQNFQEIAIGLFLGSALSGLTGHLLKFVFLRARPYGNFGPFSFFNLDGLLQNRHVFQSLPSGDVVLVAGAASFIFFVIRNHFLRWSVFFLPFCTALFRIAESKHWPSDTLASIGISLIAAHLLWQHKKP